MFLQKREQDLEEIMDQQDIDTARLTKTYHAFRIINSLLAFWKPIYIKKIRPNLQKNKENRILDIGCGDGFILHQIGKWAEKDGFETQLIGLEIDQRSKDAINYQNKIEFYYQSIYTWKKPVDIVISNHLLHHLSDGECVQVVEYSKKIASKLIIHNDIKRSIWAFLLYPNIGIWFAFHTFALIDGLRSIRRSFTVNELKNLLSIEYSFSSSYPFRVLVLHEKN